MKTFDEVLTDFLQSATDPMVAELQKDDWTEETGDKKLAILRRLEDEVVAGAVGLLKSMIEHRIDDRTVIEIFFKKEMVSAELETLLGFRAMLDATEETQDTVFTYEWLTPRIRARIEEIQEYNRLLTDFMNGSTTTEAL